MRSAYSLQRPAPAADEPVMGRAAGIVSLVLGTLVIGLLMTSQRWRASDRRSAAAEITQARQTADGVKLQQAAFAVEQFHALNGTYTASSLGGLGVRLPRGGASPYFLESGTGRDLGPVGGAGRAPAPAARP